DEDVVAPARQLDDAPHGGRLVEQHAVARVAVEPPRRVAGQVVGFHGRGRRLVAVAQDADFHARSRRGEGKKWKAARLLEAEDKAGARRPAIASRRNDRRPFSRFPRPTMSTQQEITRLLVALREGDQNAVDGLLPLLYGELHAMAHRQLSHNRFNQTLNTTALVHEAYLKLVDAEGARFEDRNHFFAVSARAMRQI